MTRIIFLVMLLISAKTANGQSVEEILAMNFEARGGLERIKSVQSQRLTGWISFGPEMGGPLQVEMARPGKIRQQVTLRRKTLIEATDGRSGWSLALPGDTEPRPLTPGELRTLEGGADFDGPLVDYRTRGNRVELAGRTKVEERDAWKLAVTLKGGEARMDYIDCQTGLEIKWEGQIESGGKLYTVESYFRDYRKVDGMMYAFRIESNTMGMPAKQVIRLEKVELNPQLGEHRFDRR